MYFQTLYKSHRNFWRRQYIVFFFKRQNQHSLSHKKYPSEIIIHLNCITLIINFEVIHLSESVSQLESLFETLGSSSEGQ